MQMIAFNRLVGYFELLIYLNDNNEMELCEEVIPGMN